MLSLSPCQVYLRRSRTGCRGTSHFITQNVVACCDLRATDAGFHAFLGPPYAAVANAAGGPLVIDLIDLLHDILRQIAVPRDGIMMLASGTPARRSDAKYFFRRYIAEFCFQLWARNQHLLEEHDLGRSGGSARHTEHDSSFMIPGRAWAQASFIRHGGQILYPVLSSQRKQMSGYTPVPLYCRPRFCGNQSRASFIVLATEPHQ